MPRFEEGIDTVQTIGEDIVRKAERMTWTALPSGVVYSLLFAPWPSEIWTPAVIQEQADLWEGYWNQNRAQPGVTGISVTQQTNPVTGNLEDVAFVGVASSTGLSSALVELPSIDFLPDNFAPKIADARAQLNEIEGG